MLQEVKEYIKEHYPEDKWRATLAEEECGDINVVYLHWLDNAIGCNCKVLTYNKWYPGLFLTYNLVLEEIE